MEQINHTLHNQRRKCFRFEDCHRDVGKLFGLKGKSSNEILLPTLSMFWTEFKKAFQRQDKS
jgi:hypothetical protein